MKAFLRSAAATCLALWVFLAGPAWANTIVYYHNDIAGSPLAATNEGGLVIWRESYRPYGERLTNSATASGNRIWFTSRRQDAETGLVYMGARYYDPVVGRFISTDPNGFDEQNLHSFNRYAYAANNPYKYVDPDGRRFQIAAGSSVQFEGDIAAMRTYLASKGVDGPLREIDRHEIVVTLQQGAPGMMDFVPGSNSMIRLDTRSGLKTETGEVQSPALGFLHEGAHAVQWIVNARKYLEDFATPDAQYRRAEERRVIEGIETPAAKILGEPVRSSHREQQIAVKCPTCRE